MPKFKTNDVTNMTGLFYDCSNLISLNISQFDTGLVEDMSYIKNNII